MTRGNQLLGLACVEASSFYNVGNSLGGSTHHNIFLGEVLSRSSILASTRLVHCCLRPRTTSVVTRRAPVVCEHKSVKPVTLVEATPRSLTCMQTLHKRTVMFIVWCLFTQLDKFDRH